MKEDYKSNCHVTVHMNSKKALLFVPLELQEQLGLPEGVRVAIEWTVEYSVARLYLSEKGRPWERVNDSRPVAERIDGEKPVGQSRLRLKDPSKKPLPLFNTVDKLPGILTKKNGVIILTLQRSLQSLGPRAAKLARKQRQHSQQIVETGR